MTNSTPVVVIKPFSPSGSLLQTLGVPGRQVLEEYALLGAFIIQLEPSQTLPFIVVELKSVLCKCVIVHPVSSLFSYVVKVPNYI